MEKVYTCFCTDVIHEGRWISSLCDSTAKEPPLRVLQEPCRGRGFHRLWSEM